jgi:beta-glucosidase
VASWLPGTEGEGVAATLFGDAPFQGQLPQSWPRTLSQEPINVGDHPYDPLFPFGWGLRTTSPHADTQSAASALAAGGTGWAARRLLALAASRKDWKPNGSTRRPGAVFGAVRAVADELSGRRTGTLAQDEAVVAPARDIAQAAIVASGGPTANTSSLIADADHAVLVGDPGRAVALLYGAFQRAR